MATKVKPSRLQVSGTPQAGQVPVYVNEDCFQWCDTGGCAQWGCITGTLCDQTDLQGALDCKANACDIPTDNCQLANGCGYTTCTGTVVASDLTPYAKTCDLPDFTCYQTKSCMVCNLTSPDDSHYPTAKAVADAMACAGTGDMLKSVYDPCGCNKDAFNYCYLYNRPTIPTDNCQLANGCGYTTCTGTVSTCADVISALGYTPYSTGNPCNYINNFAGVVSALGYTPYNATNPCGYTTCTGTISDCAGVISALGYTPYNSTNPCGYTTCTGTLTSSNISNTAYGCSWDGVTTVAPSKNAVYDKIESVISSIPTNNNQLTNGCGYTTCTGTLVPGDLATYAKCCDIPTNNCQLSNGCGYTTCTGTISTCSQIISTLGYTPYNSTNPNGYTTCTGTISTCSQIISTLGYTPYNSTNPNGYTTCTGTLSADNAGCCGQVLTKTSTGACWCDPTGGGGDVLVSTQCCNILTSGMSIWAGCQCDYDNLGTYDSNTVYLTI